MSLSHYKIVNEDNIRLEKYGKKVFETYNKINKLPSGMINSDGFYMSFRVNDGAEHNEDFEAKVIREFEGLRIYNVTKSIII